MMAMLVIAYSCSHKVSEEYCYTSINGIKGKDTIRFSMNIDTAIIADLYLCVKISNSYKNSEDNTLPLVIIFKSPDKKVYADTVSLPLNVFPHKTNANSDGCTAIEWPYIRNIRNKTPGKWNIEILRYRYNSNHPLVQGLGISVKENHEHKK